MLIPCVWSGPGKMGAQANWRGKKLTTSAGLDVSGPLSYESLPGRNTAYAEFTCVIGSRQAGGTSLSINSRGERLTTSASLNVSGPLSPIRLSLVQVPSLSAFTAQFP